ncbi:unnamed protein product [Mytilus edulis]|uniref:Chromo domain-containing protein n=1 Tax=Mytilus edulis TaxID=6550 RepID=A0A8S3PSE7_MYTED|nr:unnamed protein product [Mytilus edulis]
MASERSLRPKRDIDWKNYILVKLLPIEKAQIKRATFAETFEVERLISRKISKNEGHSNLVKWDGYHISESIYEPAIHLPDTILQTFECPNISKSLERRLESKTIHVLWLYRKITGSRKRKAFDSTVHKLAIFSDELENVKKLNYTLQKFQIENLDFDQRCFDLHEKLRSEIVEKNILVEKKQCLIKQLGIVTYENENLLNYVKILHKRVATPNSGKEFTEISDNNKSRKIREFKSKAETALWFAESYGLVPQYIKLQSSIGEAFKVDFQPTDYNKSSFQDLLDEEKQKLRICYGLTLSSKDQNVFCIVNCKEDYDSLKKSCKPIFEEINSLYKRGTIEVDGRKINLEILLGGDMKFLQILLGLGGSLCNYSCPWCRIHKGEREDMTKPWDFYHGNNMNRTAQNLEEDVVRNHYGVRAQPLIMIEPEHIIIDELHLLLQICDKLLSNLIKDTKTLDDKNVIHGEKTDFLHQLVVKIRECGVSFSVWTKKGTQGEVEWSSLTGSDYKRLLENLPSKLCFIIHHYTHNLTVEL